MSDQADKDLKQGLADQAAGEVAEKAESDAQDAAVVEAKAKADETKAAPLPDFSAMSDDQINAAGYLVRHNSDTKTKEILDASGGVVATQPMI